MGCYYHCTAFVVAGFALNGIAAHAQTAAPAPAAQQAIYAPPPGSYERVSGRNNPAVNFFGGGRMVSPQPKAYVPSNTLPPNTSMQRMRVGKPFSSVQQSSGVSPYLGLDNRESESSIPNYYQFVKPALDQQRINQVQQAQYQRLNRQFRTTAAAVGATLPNGSIPTTGHSTQFMNNGGYFPQGK
jgi:hypothetical protein